MSFLHASSLHAVSETGHTIWLTGLSGAGKSTTASALRLELELDKRGVFVIDGDDLRSGLSSDLGFSDDDRDENVRRAGELSMLVNAQGLVAIVALVSPRATARRAVRVRHAELGLPFTEVYIATPIDVCERRDPKALYKRARAGEHFHMTGVDDPYQVPEHADVTLSTSDHTPVEAAEVILRAMGLR
jgi:bifunctional enzyme CysN/CysC